jgi:predicted NUDIX family NTP pyrophosphohydrolase
MDDLQGRKSETSEVRTSLALQNFPEVDEVSFFPLEHL